MNQEKNKNRKNLIWLAVPVLAVIAIAAVFLLPNTGNDAEPVETTPAPTEVTVNATEPATEPTEPAETEVPFVYTYDIVELVDGQIQTPYGTLHYPEGLADHLIVANTCEEPYTLEFYAAMDNKREVRLFDISMGKGSGGNIGLVETPVGEVPVNVTIYTLEKDESWTEGEFITAQAMQDVINEIMGSWKLKEGQQKEDQKNTAPVISEQPVTTDTVNNLEIETPLCTLYYPARWIGHIRYECDDTQEDVYKVFFYGEVEGQKSQLLFSIYLGGDEGEQLGAVMNADGIPVPVYLLMAELDLSGWDEADAALLYSMQEESNQLIEKLPLLQ